MTGAPAAPARLYFIRHGQTAWSVTGQHTGRTDIPLSAQGEDEGRRLLPWLGRIRFAQVLTSPMRRARRTCDLAGLGGVAAPADRASRGDARKRRAVFAR